MIATALPKAELHCHIEGAAHPDLARRLAAKHGIDLSGIIDGDHYVWSDFTQFLACYDRASSVFRTVEDYRLLAYDNYRRLAEQGAIYAEQFLSPMHALQEGMDYLDLVDACAQGLEEAREEFGIEGRFIVTCVRHLGPERAEAVARLTEQYPHPCVTGFGMGGDERVFEPGDFERAFAIAADAGLELTAHAGEFGGPESVRACIDDLGVTRIGHGVRAVEDAELVARLAEEEIVLEVCPGSNVSLGLYPDMAAHPLRRLHEAGVRVTVSSDDPPYFRTTLADEYANAARLGFDDDALSGLTRTALEAAFVEPGVRRRLLARLDEI